MPIIILFIYSFYIFKKRTIVLMFSLILLIGLVFMDEFLESLGLNDLHFLLKIQGFIGDGFNSDSSNISVRLEYWKDVYKLFENPFVFLFGHVNGVSYNAGDGQYVAYLTSFGFPLFLFFIFSLFKIVYEFKFFNGLRIKLFFVAFLLILITNRYLDYWPNAIIIFLLINHLNYKKHEYWNNKSISI